MSSLAICIPAYNAENYLPRLLKSVAAQKLPFDQILVYDDCSQDRTSQVAEQYGASVIRGEVNIGCSAGKNALLAASTTEWVHFHDADDKLYPNFTQLAHQWMSSDACPDVVLFDYEYRDNDTDAILAKSDFDPQQLHQDPLSYAIRTQINPFCGLYKRSMITRVGGYDTDPAILYNEDVAFHIKLALNGLSFSAEKEVSIVNYRIPGSMSAANRVRCLHAQLEVLTRLIPRVTNRHYSDIGSRLWSVSAVLASEGEWMAMRKALEACSRLGSPIPTGISHPFFLLVKALGVKNAFVARELMIRLLKPQLRHP